MKYDTVFGPDAQNIWLDNNKEQISKGFGNASFNQYLIDQLYQKQMESLFRSIFKRNDDADLFVWVNMGDACSECQDRHENIYTQQQLLSMDIHPNCRCQVELAAHRDIAINAYEWARLFQSHADEDTNIAELVELLHFLLDMAGLIPAYGEIADIINALIYAAEGDFGNAALSAASAIPIAGWAATGAKRLDDITDAAKAIDKAIDGAESISKRDELLRGVQNEKLKNAINEIYRPGAKVGDGGLADAVRQELSSGELAGDKSHIQKAVERVKNLENIIKTQDLNQNDMNTAKELLEDIKSALGGN